MLGGPGASSGCGRKEGRVDPVVNDAGVPRRVTARPRLVAGKRAHEDGPVGLLERFALQTGGLPTPQEAQPRKRTRPRRRLPRWQIGMVRRGDAAPRAGQPRPFVARRVNDVVVAGREEPARRPRDPRGGDERPGRRSDPGDFVGGRTGHARVDGPDVVAAGGERAGQIVRRRLSSTRPDVPGRAEVGEHDLQADPQDPRAIAGRSRLA